LGLTTKEDDLSVDGSLVDGVYFVEGVWEAVPEAVELDRVAWYYTRLIPPPEPLQETYDS